MKSKLIVTENCVVRVPDMFDRSFSAGDIVEYGSRFYYALLWAGLATETGEPTILPQTEIPPQPVVVDVNNIDDQWHIEWDDVLKRWEVLNFRLIVQGMIDQAIESILGAAPENLNSLAEVAQALQNNDITMQELLLNVESRAPINSPTFMGIVSGITKSMVGLANVNDTSDADKPVSTAQQAALDLKAPKNNPTFTGTVSGITKSMVGLGNVDNTADVDKPVSTATQQAIQTAINNLINSAPGTLDTLGEIAAAIADDQSALDALTANVNSREPGITPGTTGQYYRGDKSWQTLNKAAVGLANVDNTSDMAKPVSTAVANALALKSDTGHVHTDMSKIGTGVPNNNSFLRGDGVWTAISGMVIIPESGLVTDYLRGDGTWASLAAAVSGALPTYLSEAQLNSHYSAIGHTHDDRYYTETEVNTLLGGKAASSHTHTTAQVTGLDTALAGKAAASHTHDDRYYTETEVNTLLDSKAAASHTHTTAQVTGLDTALAGKAASSHTHTSSQVTDLSTAVATTGDSRYARDTLGGSEKINTPAATTGTVTLDCALGSIFTITPSGDITLAPSNVPAGKGVTLTVRVLQGATVRTVTLPAGGSWIGSAPTHVANKRTIITMLTVDGGTTWDCSAGVQA